MRKKQGQALIEMLCIADSEVLDQAWELIISLSKNDRRFLADFKRHIAAWIRAESIHVDRRARSRTWDAADSELFASLLTEAIGEALTLGFDLKSIKIRVDSGAVPLGYRYRVESTTAFFNKGGLSFGRATARSVAGGDCGIATCKIEIPKTQEAEAKAQVHPKYYRGYIRLH
tara:strand:+ start:789 stop:1307 length:519 start_codon:yes stop_codon:yes gene_type:complete